MEPCNSGGDPYYRPASNITRGQIAKIVSESARIQDNPGEQVYEDVAPGSPFYKWINRLTNRGYMSGYPCGEAGEPCQEEGSVLGLGLGGTSAYVCPPTSSSSSAVLATILDSCPRVV